MDYFLGSVKLMLIVYALGAVISLGVAWVIKCIFAVIKMRNHRTKTAVEQVSTGTAGRA